MSWQIELNGARLRRYEATDGAGFYGWQERPFEDGTGRTAEPVTFETREKAGAWIARNEVFARGAVVVEREA